jgi:serine/threonine protein kinase/tetratricopeptide (TPR) repeat protein
MSAIESSANKQGSWEPDFFVGAWQARPALGQLQRGGAVAEVEARSMQVLVCLVKHAPNVVSKQRLIREVWGESFVSEEVLSHAIWELRKAFGDEARNPRYIQTIAKKGYRLLAEVSYRVAPEPLAPGSRIGNYEIVEMVGGGAMGEVYKARDQRFGRAVALKFLPADLARDPSARRRFVHEAKAVAALDHPNVATLYDMGESEGGRMFLALAFYEGETLQQRLERGPLPLPEAVSIARQIAQGLAAAHRLHIVHRDVKPSNVMILPDGKVKLLDFGVAKMTGATLLTQRGSSLGTPAYKSPEQTRGDQVGPRSDLWALGVVLYEMLTGRTPFGGEYEQAVIYAILNEAPPPLDAKAFPRELGAIITKALTKDPENRYATAEEMDEDLSYVPVPLGSNGDARTRPIQMRRPLRQALWIAAAVVPIVLVTAGLWWWKVHRWDFSVEVTRLVEQGDQTEWRGDTQHGLASAEKLYRHALALAPGNPLIEAQLAALLARLNVQFPAPGRMQEIRSLTADAVRRAPDHSMPWVAKAKLLLLENKPQEAEQAAREAIDQDRDFDRGYTQLGEALIMEGRLKEGLTALRHAAETRQGYVRARLILAAKLQDAVRYKEAAIEFSNVLKYNPDHMTAKVNLGNIYLGTGHSLEAIPLFQDVFEATHDFRSANGLGSAYFAQNRMTEAIAAYKQAYELSLDPVVARNLAECYEQIGQKDNARRWYELAISNFDRMMSIGGGERAELLYGRSYCAAQLGRYDEALSNVQEGISLKPKKVSFYFRGAKICAMAGRREEVYTWTRLAIREGYSRDEFLGDKVFHNYQNDPRFREILESYKH